MLRREFDILLDLPRLESERITFFHVIRIGIIKTTFYPVLSLTFRKFAKGLGGECKLVYSFFNTMK